MSIKLNSGQWLLITAIFMAAGIGLLIMSTGNSNIIYSALGGSSFTLGMFAFIAAVITYLEGR